jgi:hypothetical protein
MNFDPLAYPLVCPKCRTDDIEMVDDNIEEKDDGFSVSIIVTDNLIDPGMKDYWYEGSKEFIGYLKTKFKIQWINKDTSKNTI